MQLNLVIVLLLVSGMAQAQMQTIKCVFPQQKNGEMTLKGFDGFREIELSNNRCDNAGRIMLTYPSSYTGAAVLQLKEGRNVIVLLNRENFEMQWIDTKDVNTLTFSHSSENDALAKGIAVNKEAEQKLAGLKYLLPQYEKIPEKSRWLKDEMVFQEKQFEKFVSGLPTESFTSYYLKIRKFLTDMSLTALKDNGLTPQHQAYFKTIDLNDNRLWHSGLMTDIYAGIYQLIATNKDTTGVKSRINNLADIWIEGLTSNSMKQQEVAEYCFKMLEQQNMTSSSEYIAKSMLNKSSCQLDEKRTNLFEQYRKMAIGAIAPDILLQNGSKLSALNSNYKLMVFGASWCPDCQRDYPSLVSTYKRIKTEYNVEFVFVSLDTDQKAFDDFFKEAPFITYCDTKGWESGAVKEYYVCATPTYFLLDRDLRIVAKLKRPKELDDYLSMKQGL